MPKLLLTLLLTLTTTTAFAAWVEVTVNEVLAGYVNPTTISRKGDKVRVWELMDYKIAPDKDHPYLSTKRQTEYDCKEPRSRLLVISAYSGNLAKGDIVNTALNTSPDWKPILPGSVGEILWKTACGKRGKVV